MLRRKLSPFKYGLCVVASLFATDFMTPLSHAETSAEIAQLMTQGDYHIAREKIKEQLEENPQDSNLLLLSGRLEVNIGNFKKGIALLTHASKIDPKGSRIAYELGSTYLQHREYQLADQWLSKALSLAPHDKKIQALHFLALTKNNHPSIPPKEKLASYPLRTEFPETYFIHAVWHYAQGDLDKADYFVSAVADIISLNDMRWYQEWLSHAGWLNPRNARGI